MNETRAAPHRILFWRRLIALLIDIMFVGAIVGLVGIGLSKLTGGAIRISEGTYTSIACEDIDRNNPPIKLPADFTVTDASKCVQSFFGIPFDWFWSFQEKTRSGYSTVERTITVPLDRSGQPTRAFYLDGLHMFLIVGYIFLQEARRRRTLGKWLTGLEIEAFGGEPVTVPQAARRLLRFMAVLPVAVAFLVDAIFYAVSTNYEWGSALVSMFKWTGILSAVLLAVTIADLLIARIRGRRLMHDIWADTDVVRWDEIKE